MCGAISRTTAGTSPADETLAGLVAALNAQAGRTRAIVGAHDLADTGQPGERWDGADPPSLERVLFHLLQEYARHVGQLDIVTELAGGPVGECTRAGEWRSSGLGRELLGRE